MLAELYSSFKPYEDDSVVLNTIFEVKLVQLVPHEYILGYLMCFTVQSSFLKVLES